MEKRTTQSNADMFQTASAPAISRSEPAKVPGKQWLAAVQNKMGEREVTTQFDALLPSGMTTKRFLGSLWLYVKERPDLWGKTTPAGLLREALYAAQQGLDFAIPNECHLVPFGGKNPDVVLIRGYKGDLKMARRNPKIAFIDANDVREHDVFEIEFGDNPRVTHKVPPFGTPRGKTVGFYAVAKDINGGTYIYVMDNAEVHAHAKRYVKQKFGIFADVRDKGPEAEYFKAYGYKTVVIALCVKKLDLSSEMGEQIQREWAADKESPFKGADLGEAPAVEEFPEIPHDEYEERLQQQIREAAEGDA
jgi:phage RecT family recombinase